MKFRIGRLIFNLKFWITRLEPLVIGIDSYLNRYNIFDERNRHILLLDYDDISKEELIKDIMKLQYRFILGDAKVFRSSIKTYYHFSWKYPFLKKTPVIKWHVYFTQNSRPYFQWMEAIAYSQCDEQFKKWRLIRSCMTTRFSPKSNKFIPQPDFIVKSSFPSSETGFDKKILFVLEKERQLLEKRKTPFIFTYNNKGFKCQEE